MKISDFTSSNTDFKTCCSAFYEYDLLHMLLGSSMHPGGIELTKELGSTLKLIPDDKVLDLASGFGTPAITLGEEFGSQIIGIDLSKKNVSQANAQAAKKGLSNVTFEVGDAEQLTFSDASFDVVISECSFCLFPNKGAAAQEIFRVIKPNGRLGITDVSIEKKLPQDIQGMIFRVACIADALSLEGYKKEFAKAGFVHIRGEDRKDAVYKMIQEIKKKIFVAELAKGLKKIDLGELDLQKAKKWLKRGKELVDDGYGTYVMITARKPL
ncbi:MAG: methyltransferase domain-containing protein [Candidatus Thorarchaeota archaeon]